jgi:hypothetical protein
MEDGERPERRRRRGEGAGVRSCATTSVLIGQERSGGGVHQVLELVIEEVPVCFLLEETVPPVCLSSSQGVRLHGNPRRTGAVLREGRDPAQPRVS